MKKKLEKIMGFIVLLGAGFLIAAGCRMIWLGISGDRVIDWSFILGSVSTITLITIATIVLRAELRGARRIALEERVQNDELLADRLGVLRWLPPRVVDEEFSDMLELLERLQAAGASRRQIARKRLLLTLVCCVNGVRHLISEGFARRRN